MAAPTLTCVYVGTPASFSADAASSSSNQGTYYPANSGQTTLNGAITAGFIVGACTPFLADPVFSGTSSGAAVSAQMGVPRLVWTLYTNGVV